jgi:hypothetical protein
MNVALGKDALYNNTTGYSNVALGYGALGNNTTGIFNSSLGYGTQTGDFSGSTILGAGATATSNNQFVLGSTTHPLGPISGETVTSNYTLQINLNGNLYKLLMFK